MKISEPKQSVWSPVVKKQEFGVLYCLPLIYGSILPLTSPCLDNYSYVSLNTQSSDSLEEQSTGTVVIPPSLFFFKKFLGFLVPSFFHVNFRVYL